MGSLEMGSELVSLAKAAKAAKAAKGGDLCDAQLRALEEGLATLSGTPTSVARDLVRHGLLSSIFLEEQKRLFEVLTNTTPALWSGFSSRAPEESPVSRSALLAFGETYLATRCAFLVLIILGPCS